jgi:hypothetical protein
MKQYSTPKVSIDLQEYEDLKKAAEVDPNSELTLAKTVIAEILNASTKDIGARHITPMAAIQAAFANLKAKNIGLTLSTHNNYYTADKITIKTLA